MSETLGTLALDSGIVTSVGTLDTTTDDCDSLTYVGTTLHLIDVHSPGGVTGLFTVDPGTAATTPVTTFDDDVVRVAWDPSRDLLYGHARVARQLVTIDRAPTTR